ncbi:MAG: NfeD family protein [Eggerthellaceae bacterium]|nr:NfeD family protein [Eggerthellaceae bacterium]
MTPYAWLAVAAAMAIVEIVSLSLITIWFVAGGLAAFLAGFFGADLTIQIIVFLVVSFACLALFRPLAMKHRAIGESHESTPVGQEAVVVEPISGEPGVGRVETADHMTWAALSADGSPIELGARVRIVDQKSVRLVVERIVS